jgi:hypothetical protein
MAGSFTPEALCNSAMEFAQSALDAHHAHRFRRVAVDAGTALEHLAKASLAKRSPALLTELRSEGNFASLLVLLGIKGGRPPRRLRTVGLRDALTRARVFVPSQASDDDLQVLGDMRDGTVHAGQGDEVEERLVVAFVRQADAFLEDLKRDRGEFWAGQVGVVDALLAEATDKTARKVAVRIAGARAEFERRYGDGPAEVLNLVRQMAASSRLDEATERIQCPACESPGVSIGEHEVEWDSAPGEDRRFRPPRGKVWFDAFTFECSVCGLVLEDDAELVAAGMGVRRLLPDADPSDYDPGFDAELLYEIFRREREEREDEERSVTRVQAMRQRPGG